MINFLSKWAHNAMMFGIIFSTLVCCIFMMFIMADFAMNGEFISNPKLFRTGLTGILTFLPALIAVFSCGWTAVEVLDE